MNAKIAKSRSSIKIILSSLFIIILFSCKANEKENTYSKQNSVSTKNKSSSTLSRFQSDNLLKTRDSFHKIEQINKESFNYTIMEMQGDLNKDSLADKVIVTQDTTNEYAPYRIQVFFKQPNGQFKLIASSTKIIDPEYPSGRDYGHDPNRAVLDTIKINKNVLLIYLSLLRGSILYMFRYQNGNLELIGFTFSASDGRGTISQVDYNLSTGIKIKKEEDYTTDKVISNIKRKVLIRPLPKLQDGISDELFEKLLE